MDAVPNIVVRHAGCESAQQFRILAGVEDPPEGIRALTEEEIKDLAMRGQRGDQTGKDGGGNEPEPEAEKAVTRSKGGRTFRRRQVAESMTPADAILQSTAVNPDLEKALLLVKGIA